jgi:hypothetical protein
MVPIIPFYFEEREKFMKKTYKLHNADGTTDVLNYDEYIKSFYGQEKRYEKHRRENAPTPNSTKKYTYPLSDETCHDAHTHLDEHTRFDLIMSAIPPPLSTLVSTSRYM